MLLRACKAIVRSNVVLRLATVACVLAIAMNVPASTTSPLTMRVGTVQEHYTTQRIPAGTTQKLAVAVESSPATFALRMVIPDDLDGHDYDFEVAVGDSVVTRRGGTTRGFGRRTFFFTVPARLMGNSKELSLEVRALGREPLFVESIIPAPIPDRPFSADDFTLSLLMNCADNEPQRFQVYDELSSAPGVRMAAAREVYYASTTPEQLSQQLRGFRRQCIKRGLGFYAVTCSWWAGTPREVRDRIDFQQICWSETDNYDEGPALKELLGDKWDLRYGLTVPNRWANTPWQTMNNPELKALRHERITTCIKLLEKESGADLLGYISENEPAYWAEAETDYKYPVKRDGLLADFNPHAVADAKRDGVDLDPRGGLGINERLWLHQNVAHYMQDSIDALTSAGASTPLYTHALLGQYFPMEGTGLFHPSGETARVRGAHTGLETHRTTDVDGLWRVREWGPWGTVNREENDGMGLEYHVAMLRAQFMMGADLFNSYNWHAIQGAAGYFNDFLQNLAAGGIVTAGRRTGGTQWMNADRWEGRLRTHPDFPWANKLELTLDASSSSQPLTVELTKGREGPVVGYATVWPEEVNRARPSRIDLGDLTQLQQSEPVYLRLTGPGWKILASDEGPDYHLMADLSAERRRSQFVIKASAQTH